MDVVLTAERRSRDGCRLLSRFGRLQEQALLSRARLNARAPGDWRIFWPCVVGPFRSELFDQLEQNVTVKISSEVRMSGQTPHGFPNRAGRLGLNNLIRDLFPTLIGVDVCGLERHNDSLVRDSDAFKSTAGFQPFILRDVLKHFDDFA